MCIRDSLWASLLLRAGGLEELEGRLVAAPAGRVVVKSAKGREERAIPPDPLLFRGGGEAWTQLGALEPAPGDRVRLLLRDGSVLAVAAFVPAAAGLYERESGWIHWVRRFTGAELMTRLLERDPSRKGSVVRQLDVLSRGASGRAAKVRVTTDRETFNLAGLEVRFALALPETLFTHVTGRDEAGAPVHTFYGRGWGHGVGPVSYTHLYGLLNTRYNRKRLTILTTNFSDEPDGRGGETLETRIGAPVRSRLWEMTQLVTISADDFRKQHGARVFG